MELMFGSVVVAAILNEIAGPFLTRRLLQRAGERAGPAMIPGRPHA